MRAAGITALEPLGFNNTFAILVRAAMRDGSVCDRSRTCGRRPRGGRRDSATSFSSAPTAIPG